MVGAVFDKAEYKTPCFEGETLVHTQGGQLLNIMHIPVGWEVLSRCEVTGEIAYKKVTRVFQHSPVEVVRVWYRHEDDLPDELWNNQRVNWSAPLPILATLEHPFWVIGQGWTETRHLKAGDEFLTVDGKRATAMGIQKGFPAVVYNLEVEDFHTYFVGAEGVWVHNKNLDSDTVEVESRKAEREADPSQGFPIDTYVMTNAGRVVEIDRIGVGTLVLSRCEKTGEQAYKRVTKKFVHSRENWDAPLLPTYKIKIVTAEGKRDGLEATAEHPFWVNGIGWVPAKDLKSGQMLEICDPFGTDDCDRPVGQKTEDMILSGQRWQAEVVSVEQDTGSAIVYNIEVEDFHTYFVGVFGVWVHNKQS